jgi:hypothetical protein
LRLQLHLVADGTALQIEIWKVKKLIKRLEAARGNGTSMISLIIRMSFPFRPDRWATRQAALASPRLPSPPQIELLLTIPLPLGSAEGPGLSRGKDAG